MEVNRICLAQNAPRVFSDLAEYERDNHCEKTNDHIELFDRFLEWNGIVGYSSQIRSALYQLITCSQEHLSTTDQADTARLAMCLGVKP